MPTAPRDLDGRRLTGARIALAVFVLAVALIVFWPSPPAHEAQEGLGALLRRWHAQGLPGWISFSLVESVSNVLLFVPLGFFGALSLARRRWLVPIAAAVVSGAIELTQQVLLPGRFADLRDVAANTGGALIGWLLALAWAHRVRHRDRTRLARTGRRVPGDGSATRSTPTPDRSRA